MEQSLRRFARRILLVHLALLVLLLGVVFFATWGVYRSARDQAFEQAQKQQNLLGSEAASGLKGYYDSIFSDLELLRPINPDDEDTEDRIPVDETGVATGRNLSPLLAMQLNGRVAHLFRVDKGGKYDIRPFGKQATIPTVQELVERNHAWIDSLDKPTISPLEQFDDKQNDVVRGFILIGIPVRPALRRGYVLVASVSARATARRFFEDVSRVSNSTALLIDDNHTIIAASNSNLIGRRINATTDPQVSAAVSSLAAQGDNGAERLTRPFAIGQEHFAPALLTNQPVTVLDKQWTVIITSPLSNVDAVIRQLFGKALFWALFVALSMTAILVSTAVQLISNRARNERERHELLEKELKQAREIQLAWLPQKRPQTESLDIATVNHPASRISGDFYNWFDLPGGRTAVVIGDVTGHGMAAAFLMATTQLLVRNTLPQTMDPGRCLEEINRQLCTQVFNGQFVTLQILILDPQNERVEVGTAGHPPPLIGDGYSFQPLQLEPNLVLGVEKQSTYATETFDLSSTSTFVLYTDGVLDAEAPDGDRFGLTRFRESFAGRTDSAQGLVDATLAAIDAFRGRRPLADDLTLVAVQLQLGTAPAATAEFRHPAGLPA